MIDSRVTAHLSLCLFGFQPVVTLDGAMSSTFSKEGSHTVTVQAAVGNTVHQDQMTVAVYGKLTQTDSLLKVHYVACKQTFFNCFLVSFPQTQLHFSCRIRDVFMGFKGATMQLFLQAVNKDTEILMQEIVVCKCKHEF